MTTSLSTGGFRSNLTAAKNYFNSFIHIFQYFNYIELYVTVTQATYVRCVLVLKTGIYPFVDLSARNRYVASNPFQSPADSPNQVAPSAPLIPTPSVTSKISYFVPQPGEIIKLNLWYGIFA